MKIVFFGTPEFSVKSLERILADGHEVAAVVTMPDKPGRRGHKLIESDIKKFALSNNLKVLQPEKLRNPDFLNNLKDLNAELFVVIAFRMLPEIVWTMPPKGTINLHGSLLPNYRGAAPINRAIMAGETETGVTTFFLKHEIDTGDIIASKSTPIYDSDDAGTLHDRLMQLGADLISETLQDIESGNVDEHPQPDGNFSPAPKIFAEDMIINWNNNQIDIHNQVRGLSPYPGARAELQLEDARVIQVKILQTKILKDLPSDLQIETEKMKPGMVVHNKKKMYVACSDGLLEIITLQPAGKKNMSANDFLLGYSPAKFNV